MKHIACGDEVQFNGDWYPVIGLSLICRHEGPTTGSVFTLKPIGQFEPCLGYRINYADIQAVRHAGRAALEKGQADEQ